MRITECGEMNGEASRHPDLLDSKQAAAYLGVSRLADLPVEFQPSPVAYHRSLYHRLVLDDLINRAANQAERKKRFRVAL